MMSLGPEVGVVSVLEVGEVEVVIYLQEGYSAKL